MTFKKLFAGITSIAMVFSVVAPVNFASANAAEDLAAYTWGYDEGLTTMTSFDAFNFENAITREQAAKFLVAGAEALGLEDNIGGQDETCDYADLGSADTSLISYIAEGCELGLFKAQTNFRPLEVFTRGQAELVVARMLNGYDAVNDYADDNGLGEFEAAHEMLMNDDVVHVNVDLNSAVRRGHLMLMLYRLQDAEPTDPDAPVNPGHAEVSRVASAGTQEVPRNAVNVKVGTIKITAGSNPTRVSSVEVSRDGLANLSSSNTLEVVLKNPAAESRVGKVNTNTNKATVKFSPALELKAGQAMNFDVVATLSGNDTNGTHNFKVTDMVVANGTASGTPISLGTIKTTSASSKNVLVGVAGDVSAKAGEKNVTLATVTADFNDAAGTLNSFVLTNTTTDRVDEAFGNGKAYINDVEVGTVSFSRDKVIVSGINKAVDKNDDVVVKIKADVTYVGATAAFKLELDSTRDFAATESNNGFGLLASGYSGDVADVSINGYDIKMKRVAVDKDILPGTKNAKIYEATIESASDIILNSIALTGAFESGSNFSDVLVSNTVKLFVAGEEFEVDANGVVNGNNVDIAIFANTPATVRVTANVDKNYTGKIQYEFGVTQAEDEDGNNIVNVHSKAHQSGTIITVKGASVSVDKVNATSTANTIYTDSQDQEIGRFSMRGANDKLVLKSLTVALNTTGSTYTGDLDELINRVYLVADGLDVNESVDTNEAEFEGMNYTLEKGKTVRFTLMANFDDVSDYEGQEIQLSVTEAEFRDSNSKTVTYDGTKNLDTYTFDVKKPGVNVSGATSATPLFRVQLTNSDDDFSGAFTGIEFSAQVDPNDYAGGNICLVNDMSDGCSEAIAQLTGFPGTSMSLDLTAANITFNDDEDYYVVIESTGIANEITLTLKKLMIGGKEFKYNASGTWKK